MLSKGIKRNFSKIRNRVETPSAPRRKGIKIVGSIFLGCLGLYTYTNSFKTKLNILYTKTDKNLFLLGQIREFSKKYVSTFYLPLSFMETILATMIETPPYVKIQEDELKLKSGDFLDLGNQIFLKENIRMDRDSCD